ncbi:MAG: NAD(P)H-binding protein [Cyclobacteriaceae bacterium]|nr:NAD(P)H-binding protein [Cyclobacteriaceae bacterium]
MKYVITGSIGHISKPVTKKLIEAGHSVTVITSNTERVKYIEALGAKAAVGSVQDTAFITSAFAGADAVYLMVPPNWALTGEWLTYQQKVVHNYIDSIKSNGVKNVVLLSSIGAHLRKGAGPVDGLGYAEEKLAELKDVNVKVLRPSYFYYNLFGMLPLIKNMNIVGSNFGSTDEKLVMVHTNDIADVVAEEFLGLKFKGYSIRYIASDERHPKEIAEVLGKAVGKPGTPWVEFKDADALNGMLQSGLSQTIANGYMELGAGIRNGKVQEDYWKNRPATLGKIKLEDFAKEFAGAFQG